MKLVVVLADAELELAPAGTGLPALDAYFHRDLVKSMDDGDRRGRGDIVHSCLLLLQGSELNRQGNLGVFVHTRGGQVIAVEPGAKIAPNYIRFLQQMGSLLAGGKAEGYSLSDRDFKQLIAEIGADLVVAMSPHGRDVPLSEVLRSRPDGTVAVVMGAFPCGDYQSPVYELCDVSVSLGPELLTVPEVVRRVLSAASENP
ncbi:hypothetical protein [Methanomassiliicoccus luminyensis]|uniref:hypothetical protein n=1 Tax=Methanomassiliicoccus luminyensis TaxID=1080712 RepID=UPI00036A95DB|nr:hypothetical protein [Methanomassiliicoccus luminyensis]